MTVWTPAATASVPVSQLLQRLTSRQLLLGISLTPRSSECAVLHPPYLSPSMVLTGVMLDSDGLVQLVAEQQVSGLVLGGSGLFRADGQTHYGARKLISGVMGIVYDGGSLPRVVSPDQRLPVWLCRRGEDNPCELLLRYLEEHVPGYGAAPAQGRPSG